MSGPKRSVTGILDRIGQRCFGVEGATNRYPLADTMLGLKSQPQLFASHARRQVTTRSEWSLLADPGWAKCPPPTRSMCVVDGFKTGPSVVIQLVVDRQAETRAAIDHTGLNSGSMIKGVAVDRLHRILVHQGNGWLLDDLNLLFP